MAAWVIGYGVVQALVPGIAKSSRKTGAGLAISLTRIWGIVLALIPIGIGFAVAREFHVTTAVIVGLGLFGIVFAVNSSLHSFLILAFSDSDKVALNVGFYYMANALGRLVGTFLSGLIYYLYTDLAICLWTSAGFLAAAALFTFFLKPRQSENSHSGEKLIYS